MKKERTKYRVWIEQINAQYVEVFADNAADAEEKGYRKWRRDYSHSHVTDVKKMDE